MNKTLSKYWLCQIGGWSTYIIVYTFFYLTLHTKEQPDFFKVLFIDAILGIGITHLMRSFIQRFNLLNLRLDNQITFMFLITLVASLVFSFTSSYLEDVLNFTSDSYSPIRAFK